MALPFAFIAVTSATGAQLDADFNAVGNMGTFPCAVSGTNAITMTPTAGITPSVAALANYMRFSGIVGVSNSTAITIQIGGLSALNGYKDSASGPVALTGGELIAGNAFTAVYDSALNTGAGGFHIIFSTAFAGGMIAGNVILSGGYLAANGGLLGATLASTLLTGNSLTISALRLNATTGSLATATITNLANNIATISTLSGSIASISTLSASIATLVTLSGSLATLGTVSATIASITSLSVGASASPLLRMISGIGTLSYSVTGANATQDQTFALAGAQIPDSLSIGLGTAVPAGAGFTGFISAAGSITLRLVNPATVTLGAATITVRATALGFT